MEVGEVVKCGGNEYICLGKGSDEKRFGDVFGRNNVFILDFDSQTASYGWSGSYSTIDYFIKKITGPIKENLAKEELSSALEDLKDLQLKIEQILKEI